MRKMMIFRGPSTRRGGEEDQAPSTSSSLLYGGISSFTSPSSFMDSSSWDSSVLSSPSSPLSTNEIDEEVLTAAGPAQTESWSSSLPSSLWTFTTSRSRSTTGHATTSFHEALNHQVSFPLPIQYALREQQEYQKKNLELRIRRTTWPLAILNPAPSAAVRPLSRTAASNSFTNHGDGRGAATSTKGNGRLGTNHRGKRSNNSAYHCNSSACHLHFVRTVLITLLVISSLEMGVAWYTWTRNRSLPLITVPLAMAVRASLWSGLDQNTDLSLAVISLSSFTPDDISSSSSHGRTNGGVKSIASEPRTAVEFKPGTPSLATYVANTKTYSLQASTASVMLMNPTNKDLVGANNFNKKPSDEDLPSMSMMQLARALGNGINPSNSSEAPAPLTVAVCHKSLFGTLDLTMVARWAAYYRVLGVDHVFIWYIPEIESHPSFSYLSQLPFVTMIKNEKGKVMTYPNGYTRIERGVGGDQQDNERECLRYVANKYDWVLIADADEYLWWDRRRDRHPYSNVEGFDYMKHWAGEPALPIAEPQTSRIQSASKTTAATTEKGGSAMLARIGSVEPDDESAAMVYDLKDFLLLYQNYTYLSFGKWLYSGTHTITRQDSIFVLDQYPFTAKSYCRKPPPLRGSPICPRTKGRSKLLVRPRYYHRIAIHGTTEQLNSLTGAVQFHTSIAHMKEWPSIFKRRKKTYYRLHDDDENLGNASNMDAIRRDGLLLSANDTGILHEVTESFVPADRKRGLYRLHYDQENLDKWIRGMMNEKIRQVAPRL